MNCKYCTYYKQKGETCQFENCMFAVDEAKADTEFPCKDDNYLGFLISMAAQERYESYEALAV